MDGLVCHSKAFGPYLKAVESQKRILSRIVRIIVGCLDLSFGKVNFSDFKEN